MVPDVSVVDQAVQVFEIYLIIYVCVGITEADARGMEYNCLIFSKYLVFQIKNLVFQSKYLVFRLKTLDFDRNTRYFESEILKY